MIRRILTVVVALSLIACFAADASAWTIAQRRAARQNARQAQRLQSQQFRHHGQQIILAPSVYQVPGTQTIILR